MTAEVLRRYRRGSTLALVAALLVFLASADALLLSLQRSLVMDEARLQVYGELDLLSALVREVLTRGDYATAEDLLSEWATKHTDVVALRARAANGFQLLDFQRPGVYTDQAEFQNDMSYGEEGKLHLELVKDFAAMNERLLRLGIRYVLASLLGGLVLGLLLWWLLRSVVLGPLERAVAEEETRNRELAQRLRGLMTHTPALVYIKDRQGRYVEANGAYAEVFGRRPGELIGHTDQDLFGSQTPFTARETGVFATACAADCEVTLQREEARKVYYCNKFPVGKGPSGEVTEIGSIAMDITDAKHHSEALEYQALHDTLTDLPNRTLLYDRLKQALYGAQRERHPLALFMMDLDRFKEVNDTLGHPVGDKLLVEVAQRLRAMPRNTDTVARLGGDEFAMVLPLTDEDDAVLIAHKVSAAIAPSVRIEEHTLHVGISIGIALFPRHGLDADELLKRADVAMYQAKREGGGVAVYDAGRDEYSPQRLALSGDLRRAVKNKDFVLHYQPKVDMRSRGMRGVEALVRWRHVEHGLLAPDEFIPLAEQSGLITPITRWVLGEAMGQMAAWREQGMDIDMAVNLSAVNLQDSGLADLVEGLLKNWNVPATRLELEITESAIMTNPIRSLETLKRLDEMGVRLSIDDFGTGYASLSYLKLLPVHELKIDKSFVMGMSQDRDDAMIVRATIDLAHDLGLKVVAEGVESERTWEMLAALGCDNAQGFYMNKPLEPDALLAWFQSRDQPTVAPELLRKTS